MEHSINNAEMLEKISCPALIVKDGIITQANHAAMQHGIELNSEINSLIAIGAEEYQNYAGGKLCLTLCIHDLRYNAVVTTAGDCHVFTLASDYEDPELRAFALAAQQLREPLAAAMLSTEQLLPNSSVKENDEVRQHISQVNRSLHQLLRAVCNMSDAAHYAKHPSCRLQTQELVSVFAEILQKSAALAEQTERTLEYTLPNQTIYALADPEKLERAVLNLLSNAIKFTPKGGKIEATLRNSNNKLFFTVQDSGDGVNPQTRSNMFSRFLREPGLDDSRTGIGLGMSIVRSVATAHGGTVLMEQPEGQGARITMTLALTQPENNVVRTPVLLPVDYAGGKDHALLELSDVLSCSAFEENN